MKSPKALSLLCAVFVFSVVGVGLTLGSDDFTVDEENVLILTEDDFQQALKKFKYLLVDFHAPWCARCKTVALSFGNASLLLQSENSEVRLAKVDATEELELAEKYGIRSYPTAKFFENGLASDFKILGREATEIVAWLRRRATGHATKTVEKKEDLDALLKDFDPVVVGFFESKSSGSAKEFLKLAESIEELTFAVTYNQQLRKAYNADDKETVSIFKQSAEDRVDLLDPIDEDRLKDFIEVNRLPLIIEFGPEMAPKIFERKIKKHLILFTKSEMEAFDDHLDALKEVAKEFKGKIISIYIDVDVEANKKILDWFKMKRSDCPTVRLVDLEGPMNYKPDSDDWKKLNIRKFVQDVLDGKQKAYFISEDIPEDWDDRPVKILVGKNFDEIVRDDRRNVFVYFYAPWSDKCKELFPVWDALGEKFKKKTDVVIAKIDATKNEIDGVQISEFPSFVFFPRNSDEMFTFTGNQTLERFVKFVERGGKLAEDSKKEKTKTEETPKDEL